MRHAMWLSAGLAGAILAGGVAVAATAVARGAADGADRVRVEPRGPGAEASYAPGHAPGKVPGGEVPEAAEPTRDPDDFVVSTRVNDDPRDVAEFWTRERMESAEPLPLPVVTVHARTPGHAPPAEHDGRGD